MFFPYLPLLSIFCEAVLFDDHNVGICYRLVMVDGCATVASLADTGWVEGELLPLVWEQMAHKHPERRLFVAQLCAALADRFVIILITYQLVSTY